jgi:error-prone DNA polymerase
MSPPQEARSERQRAIGTQYAELAVTTNFSFLRGASHPEELAFAAARLGLAGIAVADRNTLAGVVRGHLAAKEAGLRYAVGCRLVFRDNSPDILAWPKTREAYGRLCRLLTEGNRRAPKGQCFLDLADLIAWGQGMILGVVPEHLDASLDSTLAALGDAFPGAVRLMLRRDYASGDQRRMTLLARTAARFAVPLMATNDVLYHVPERRRLQDILTCIREHKTLANAGKLLAPNAERALKPADEMARLFRDFPEALAETRAVLDQLAFSLDELSYQYPDEPTGDAASPQEALERLTEEGACRRFPAGVPEKIRAILDHELKLIARLRFAAYFLTVHDIIRFARSRGILCQGRGSAANSAVCYCLGITEVNPETCGLLFERFISEERGEPPDIDVDFEHERREEVMQYIYEKYGRERAGLTATVITYRSRSAVREVGKVFGLSEDAVGALSGTVWGWSSGGVRKEDVKRIGMDPEEKTMAAAMAYAKEIGGFPRHLSQHVGGFVITRDRLDEVCPIMNAAMEERTTIEWDKDDLDALGILKVDILALGMLSCIRRAFEFMKAHYGVEKTLANIQDEDPAVYRMLQKADSVGVFQVESRAQMSMLPRLKPAKFYDLVIEVAIVRPGPIQGDMVHPYLRRRSGAETVVYPAPKGSAVSPLEEVLGKTLGVPLFQEQAMKIAIVAAGFTPGEADKLRRAMATFKRVGTIGTFQTKMVEGMVERGYERDFAERCFHQIEGFGEYGFPESHAASFALLVYASAWLKCHYPDVFCAALLNAQPLGFYAPAQIVRDATRHGVTVLAPDVNASDWDSTLEPLQPGQLGDPLLPSPFQGEEESAAFSFTRAATPALAVEPHHPQQMPPPPERGRMGGGLQEARRAEGPTGKRTIFTTHAVRLGLRQIKGFREDDARALMEARRNGYDSVRDLWLRSGLTRGQIERLADGDAFRSLGLDRRDALWAARGLGGGATRDRLPLFDVAAHGDIAKEPDFPLPPMPIGEHVVNDYRYLHLSLKAHPLFFLRAGLTARRIISNSALRETPNNRRVTVAGLVIIRQRPGTAKGVIFMTLEDETDIANVIVWPKTFERFRPIVLGARLVAVIGTMQSQSGVIHVVADTLKDLTPLLAALSEDAGDLSALARGDEVRRPAVDQREKIGPRSRLVKLAQEQPGLAEDLAKLSAAAGKAMPKGRNFH